MNMGADAVGKKFVLSNPRRIFLLSKHPAAILSRSKEEFEEQSFSFTIKQNPHLKPFEGTGASVESQKAAFSLQKMKRIGMIKTGKIN